MDFSLKFVLHGILLSSTCLLSSAQILTVTPTFPTMDDTVTIIYNAALGNGALKDKNTAVYAHAGLITEHSVTSTDWKYVQGIWGTPDSRVMLSSLGNNLYQLKYHMRSFYRINSNERVLQMAFVFRNADGSIVGRDPQGLDIYYDLRDTSQNLQTRWESLSGTFAYCKAGDVTDCSVIASSVADISIFVNDQLIRTSHTDKLKCTYTLPSTSQFEFRAEVNNGIEKKILRYACLNLQNSPVSALPAGYKMGANILPDSSIRFVLAAPMKKSVYLLASTNDFQPQLMHLSTDGYSFWTDIRPLVYGEPVYYQYLIDGSIFIADPLSELVLDTRNDASVPSTVFPDIPVIRKTQINGFISVTSNERKGFAWSKKLFIPPDKTRLNIYEILIRDFDQAHSFDAITSRLDYLQELGINAIELMPVNEFEGNNSWGYNPAIHQSLDKYYGTATALKTLVDQCHIRGMAVIMDVVFNHAFGQSPLARMYWDAVNNRPESNSPYLNPVARHPYNVGYDINHESAFTKRYVNQILSYLLTEYQIDGFRFDLSKGFTQTDYGNDVDRWSRYDAARINILKNYANQIWSVKRNAYVILEHFAENSEELELSAYGMLLWGNMNYNYNQWTMGFSNNNVEGVLASKRGWKSNLLIGYMESHDEERLMYKNLLYGNASGNYKIKELNTALKRTEMANVFFWLLPGPKMIWQFGELGYDYSINTCIGGSTNQNCRLDPKPIRWDYFQNPDRQKLYQLIRKLIYLRNNYDVVHSGTLNAQVQESSIKQFSLESTSLSIVAAANGDVSSKNLSIQFPHTGKWYEYFTGDSVSVNNSIVNMNLEAGEYHVWTDRQITLPVAVNNVQKSGLRIFPNPTSERITIVAEDEILQVRITDLEGKLVFHRSNISVDQIELSLALPAGQFIVTVITAQGSFSRLLNIVTP
ncbi:MAG: T9SS type A sorting domain-containing protein [Saprospiraceae bacterium]|nr:T9SS type A sorting domain-containing protein [Saprospiraceae bacterium]HMW39545.1 alpha-amylase family glycosyl hydrolase [Saprospiraceae bacterium]HMX88490.1 alpha-amylase family glycosyl hydrolase [Saprospiraceae bacterium]HMZ40508.1 alpha-amylase family glycosyl hydrolase [Saprospiraceae bacterium]HNA64561.1 alpha-amylase family glycosyl hydrolase [Saprospiraceae bacterium]